MDPQSEVLGVSSTVTTLDGLHEALGESMEAAVAAGLTSQSISWVDLLNCASFESAVAFGRSGLGVIAQGAPDDVCFAVRRFFEIAAVWRAGCAVLALGGFLTGLRSAAATPKRAARVAIVKVCQLWLDAGGPLACIAGLVRGSDISVEAEDLCMRFLCSFADLVAPLCGGLSRAETATWEPLGTYSTALASALLETWHGRFHDGEVSARRAPELLAHLALRGEASELAPRLCAACLACGAPREPGRLCDFGGVVLAQVLEENAAAGCNLVDAVLEASEAIVVAEKGGLRAVSDASIQLLPSLLGGSLKPGGPVHHLLADRIWRRSLGSRLSPAVLFSVVDLLRSQSDWAEVCTRWFQRWADAEMCRVADLGAERALALRLARAVSFMEGAGSSDDLVGSIMHLLLRGVQLRLSARIKESRWYGMVIAETIARCWPCGDGENVVDLRFDGFDLDECGLAVFRLAGAKFQVSQGDVACEPGTSAARLRLLLCQLQSGSAPCAHAEDAAAVPEAFEGGHAAQNLSSQNVSDMNVTVNSVAHTPIGIRRPSPSGITAAKYSGEVATPVGENDGCANDDDADSDDDDSDDPLRGLAELPPLQTPRDTCADLRLVQPPKFLRSAYEMLVGPLKPGVAGTLLPQAGASSPQQSASSELPATARARIAVALATLPSLVRGDTPDLPHLTDALCARVLHMGDIPCLEELAQQRQEVLVSLLVAEGSRRAGLRFLIVEFGAQDTMLATRILALNALSDAAKELSNSATGSSGRAHISCATAAGRAASSKDPKVRRFASATCIPPSLPNRFSAELRPFLFPLIARWRQPDEGAAKWAAADPLLVGTLLQCAGILLECGGAACPDRDDAASLCLDLAEECWSHSEPQIRRCSVFLLSRVLLVGGESLIWDREKLLDQVDESLLREGDDTCRSMAGGVLAWLRRRGG